MNLVQIAAGIGGRSAVPALVIFVPHDVVHQARDILLRSLLQRVGGVGNQPARIQALGLFVHPLGEGVSRRILAVNLVADAPRENARVIAVALDHLAKLLEAVVHDVGRGLRAHVLECRPAPGGHLGLNQNSVPVAPIEHAAVLRPVYAGVDAIQFLEIRMVVRDPLRGFGHAEFRIAAGHALGAHQAHALAVQEEAA